jgi:hypothetical protein
MTGAALDLERRLAVADAWAELGYSPHGIARELVDAGVPPVAGAAQGLNPAVFMNNVPAPGTYAIDQQRFDLLTERNDVPQTTDTWPGFQSRVDRRVANVGVLANVRIRLNLSLVVSGTGAVTSLYRWPWGLIKRASLNANGGSAIISCEGSDLRARRQRLFRNPHEIVSTAPATDVVTAAAVKGAAPRGNPDPGVIANGTYTVQLVYDLPIVHDPASLTGALFAQSDQNYLNWVLETAQSSELFSIAAGGAVAITGTVDSTLTFFSIPSMDAQNGRVVVLPQAVRWLHEFIAQDNNFSNTGKVPTPFIRNNGQLVAAMMYVDNGGAAQIAPSALSRLLWTYAGNQTPRELLPHVILEENQRDYNGLIQPNYVVLDFEKENPARDLVYPRGLAELALVIDIPTSVTVNANAHTHTVLETLTAGG